MTNGVIVDKKYNRQIITVRFPISAMAANPEYGNRNSWNSSHPYKYQIDGPLEMDSKKLFFWSFYCYPDNSEASKLITLKAGDYITTQGLCSVKGKAAILRSKNNINQSYGTWK